MNGLGTLDLNQLTNAEYAVSIICARNKTALESLGTTPDEVSTLVRYAHAYWYQHMREEVKDGCSRSDSRAVRYG